MDIVIIAAQLLLSLSLLIVLHEFGHFLPAKYFNTRVEKFYLFFDPWFSVFKKKIGGTEYGIGWLPLGGYVKISGMIDESMDKEQMAKPPEPWEFRSKPTWQRLIIMLGGVTVNVILAVLIYWMVMFTWGERYLTNEKLTDGIWLVNDLGAEIGLQTGDKIVSIDGNVPYKFPQDAMESILYSRGKDMQVERDGKIETLHIPEDFIEKLVEKQAAIFTVRIPFFIGSVPDTSINANSGLKKRDKVVGIAGQRIQYFDEGKELLSANKGKQVPLVVERKGEEVELQVSISDKGFLEVKPMEVTMEELGYQGIYDLEIKKYGFFAALPAGMAKASERLGQYVKQFQLIFDFSSGAYKGVGGFGAFAKMFPAEWRWEIFWRNTAFISIILAFMNVLPIPALDGGHVVFLLYEMVTRRKPSQKILEGAQVVGFVLLLTLLVLANGNDIYKAFFR